MLGLINWRLKVTVNDGRAFVGQMLAFDRHMNLVLAECEEFRRVRPKKKQGETDAGPMQEMKRNIRALASARTLTCSHPYSSFHPALW